MLDAQSMLQQAHREELLQAAERDRLIAQAHADQPGLPDRLLLGTGDLLVGTGLRIYARYQLRRFHRVADRAHSLP